MLGLLHDLKIKTLASGLIVLLLVAGGVVVGSAYRALQDVEMVEDTWTSFAAGPALKKSILADLRDALGLGGMIHNFKNLVLRGDPAYAEQARDRIRHATAAVAAYREAGVNPVEARALETVEGVLDEYQGRIRFVEQMIARGAPIEDIDREVQNIDDPVIQALETLDRELQARLLQSEQAVQLSLGDARGFTAAMAFTTVTLIAVLIVTFLWFAQMRLVRPLAALMRFIERVGSGDLTQQMRETGRDEVGTLGRYLNAMVESLKEITIQTRNAVQHLNSAAGETLASTQQQTASVEEQFAAVQQTTATLEEISQSGAQMTERAKDIAAAADQASAAGRDGLHAVNQMAEAMSAIKEQAEAVAENIVVLSEKTQAIGEIIATADDIAERSHLLALNAAIEAAAAGEHGRSFSVVAEEMKNLADQAKAGTGQIRAILGDIQQGISSSVMLTEESVKRVMTGRHQAETTQATIEQLAANVQSSVRAFEQVAASASQQQIGLEQVAQALQHIRRASEQTAAGTRQVEEAVASINTLGTQLNQAMERYAV